ncbi:LIM/homeobox protein Lhx8-like [Aptenodytes patagonicus]|uniref:LIM/homeobox protein Lhx8-like n=1 Tax=Aptenodytes patagonicus TaxID=9234 RepID=UPI003F9FCB19
MFVCRLEDKDLPALGGPSEKASPAAADEDSCSSSAALSPSSSPRSMASGSGCAPGKCVCSSCGLEIVDKYLLKYVSTLARYNVNVQFDCPRGHLLRWHDLPLPFILISFCTGEPRGKDHAIPVTPRDPPLM